jgi:tape measure domain-containing protein
MSTNVGSIHYDLKLDTTNFDAESAKVKSKLATMGSGLSSIGDSAVKLSAGILGVGAALGVAANAALNNASDYQQSRIAFDTMLGSAEEGQKIMKRLSDFAKKTPFDLPQVVQGAKSLLAYGIEADKIVPTFNALGNIAAGVGRDKLPQLTLAFGQVRTAGRLTGQELRQFTEAGVPLLDVLAKQSGKTAKQVKEDMERGIAPSFQEVEQAMFSMSDKGGKFFNLMEKQSNTFAGRMSNIADSVGQTIRGMLGVDVEGNIEPGSVFDKVSNAAERLMKWLEDNKSKIEKYFKDAFQWILENGDVIAVMVGTILTAAFAKLAISVLAATWPVLLIAGAVGLLYLLYKQFKPQIDIVIGKLKEFWDIIKPIRDFITNEFKKAWDDLKKSIDEFMKSTGITKEQLVLLAGIIALVVIAPTLILIGIIGLLVYAIMKVVTWVIQFQTWLNNSAATMRGWYNTAISSVSAAIQGMINWFSGLGSRIANAVGNLGGTLWNAGYTILQGFWNGLIAKWSQVANWLSSLGGRIRNLKGPIDKDRVLLVQEGNVIMQGLNKGMIQGFATVEDTLSGFNTQIGNFSPTIATPAATTNSTSVNNNIYGNITLGDQSAVNRFFDKLNRNNELSAKGMTTI